MLMLCNFLFQVCFGNENYLVGNYKYCWLVLVEGMLMLFFVDGKDQYKDNVGEFSVEVYCEVDIFVVVVVLFEDLINFECDNWNNWQVGFVGYDFYLVDVSICVVEFIIRFNKNYVGEIFKKILIGLIVGYEYIWMVKIVCIIGKYEVLKVLLCVDGKDIFVFLELKQVNEWVILSGKFKVMGSQVEFVVVSYVLVSMGNDFCIKELKIKG